MNNLGDLPKPVGQPAPVPNNPSQAAANKSEPAPSGLTQKVDSAASSAVKSTAQEPSNKASLTEKNASVKNNKKIMADTEQLTDVVRKLENTKANLIKYKDRSNETANIAGYYEIWGLEIVKHVRHIDPELIEKYFPEKEYASNTNPQRFREAIRKPEFIAAIEKAIKDLKARI